MAPTLDIIVPQHNHADTTIRLLRSIRDTTTVDYRVILVDNGSRYEAFQRTVGALRPQDRSARFTANEGYTKAVNVGLRLSKTAPFVCFQDNDTLVYPGCYERLIGHLERHGNLGMVGPLCNDNESVQSIRYRPALKAALERLGSPAAACATAFNGKLMAAGLLATFCAVTRREVIDEVGLLDERFYGYGVDDDYCDRIRGAGYELALALDVYIHHDQRTTTRPLIGDAGIIAEGDRALALLAEKRRMATIARRIVSEHAGTLDRLADE